uniref:BLTX547 n=1 Tax=Nephila pilipes TaxID=299642 RepID=A0A076KZV8_NEPPI|nr:BLTX547 [Nephila pilipes]
MLSNVMMLQLFFISWLHWVLVFDCASKNEIESVLSIGVEPERIIYANPCKTRGFIKHAANVGVKMMTFDNEMELHKVKALHPDAELVIRIRVG